MIVRVHLVMESEYLGIVTRLPKNLRNFHNSVKGKFGIQLLKYCILNIHCNDSTTPSPKRNWNWAYWNLVKPAQNCCLEPLLPSLGFSPQIHVLFG